MEKITKKWTKEEIVEKLKEIIANDLGFDLYDFKEISDTTSLKNDLGLDSLELLDLEIAAEEAFDIKISFSLLKTFNTFGDLTYCISSKLKI